MTSISTQPAPMQGEPIDGVTLATLVGLETSISTLSALVDDQRAILVDIEQICGVDDRGAPFEDGESVLIDRVRAHLAMTTALQPNQEQGEPVQRQTWVDVAIRGDMARAVFDAIRVAVPSLGPWHAFDAREVQRMADVLKPFMQASPPAAPAQPDKYLQLALEALAPLEKLFVQAEEQGLLNGANVDCQIATSELRKSAYAASDIRAQLNTTPPAQPAPVQEPVFWYRPVGDDGGYEGPIHNSAIERVRKMAGTWKPLYTDPQPAPVQDEPVALSAIAKRCVFDAKE